METTTTATGEWNRGRENANKGKTLPAEALTADEVNRLIAACGSRSPTGMRNRALIVVLWRAGLRVSEALGLAPKDIDHAAGTIRVLHGKGNKSRVVGIDQQALAVVQRWMDRRAELGINGRQPVLCTLNGQPMATAYVRNLLKRLATKAGIEKRVHPHGLRHTCAAEMRSEGHDIGIISKQLGHSSIATTHRYLNHVNPAAIINTMRARTW